MWMMVVVFSMVINGTPTQVGQVTIKNFANQPDCLAKMATVTVNAFDQVTHTISAVCQAQP